MQQHMNGRPDIYGIIKLTSLPNTTVIKTKETCELYSKITKPDNGNKIYTV